jgi:hypothetical protein
MASQLNLPTKLSSEANTAGTGKYEGVVLVSPHLQGYQGFESSRSKMVTQDEFTEAKLSAVEARTDTKIVRLEGKLETLSATIISRFDQLSEKLSADQDYNRNTRWFIIGSALTSFFALAGLLVAMMTYGDALFGRGMNVRDVIQTTVEQTRKSERPNAP